MTTRSSPPGTAGFVATHDGRAGGSQPDSEAVIPIHDDGRVREEDYPLSPVPSAFGFWIISNVTPSGSTK